MSQSLPPPQGSYPPPWTSQPAYLGYPAPATRSAGLNPWLAAGLGLIVGGILTFLAMTLVPMLLFGLMMGGPGFDEGFMGPPTRVTVSADGSVSGEVLATAMERDGFYEDVTCPDTAKVATDVTTICESDGSFDVPRVVVVFRGTEGRFATAELFE